MKSPRYLSGIVAVIVAAYVAGCGGTANTPNGPTVGSTGAPVPPPPQLVSARLVVTLVPGHANVKRARRPEYLSPNTRSISVALASVNGTSASGVTTATVNTYRAAPGCAQAGSKLVCSATIQASPGHDVFNVTTYQWPNATGAILSSGTIAASIGSGGGSVGLSNTLSLSVGGVIATLSLSLSRRSVARGTRVRIPVTLRAFDASGAEIIGASAFVSPIALAVEGNGVDAFSLRDGTQSGPSLSIARPPQNLTLNYDGNKEASNVTLQASVSEPNSASANVPFTVRGSPPPLPPGTIYALNAGTHAGAGATVTVYDGTANGNAVPKQTLQLSKKLYARSIAVDSKGNLYVGYLDNELGFSPVNGTPDTGNVVAVFGPNASGSAQPTTMLTADPTTHSALFPIALSLDSSDNLVTYGATGVDGNTGDAVLVYANGSSGAAAPAHAWEFASPQIHYAGATGLALDGANNFYVNGTLKTALGPNYGVFVNPVQNDGNPSATPSRTVPWDATTQLVPGQVGGIALDDSGEIYVDNYTVSQSDGATSCQAQANVFASGSSGGTTDDAPLRVLIFGGVSTTNSLCYSPSNPLAGYYPFLFLYGTTAFTADEFGDAIEGFSAESNGIVTATKQIAGSNTGLSAPIGVFVTAASNKKSTP